MDIKSCKGSRAGFGSGRGRTLAAAFVVSCLLTLLPSAPALAQALPDGIHLGMTADELEASGFELRKVLRPERMSNGARGLWQQTRSGEDGLRFELTYFMRGASLDRVDMVLVGPVGEPAGASFERIVGRLREQFGPELRASSSASASVGETASWTAGGDDIAVYMTGPRDAERIRIVYRRRELKDGATL